MLAPFSSRDECAFEMDAHYLQSGVAEDLAFGSTCLLQCVFNAATTFNVGQFAGRLSRYDRMQRQRLVKSMSWVSRSK